MILRRLLCTKAHLHWHRSCVPRSCSRRLYNHNTARVSIEATLVHRTGWAAFPPYPALASSFTTHSMSTLPSCRKRRSAVEITRQLTSASGID
jgi:hypothetical protein